LHRRVWNADELNQRWADLSLPNPVVPKVKEEDQFPSVTIQSFPSEQSQLLELQMIITTVGVM